MKAKLFASAALALSVLAAPAFAEGGYIGANWSNIDVDGAGSADGWGLEGAFAGSNVQFDADYANVDDSDAYGATIHLFKRDETHAFGGFLGLTDSDASDSTVSVGVEGHKYMDAVTLVGGLGYVSGDDDDAWGASVGARMFATDNFRFDLGVGYLSGDDDDGWNFGVGAEARLGSSPVSLTARYDRTDFGAVEADTIMLGVRFNFGDESLKGRDRNGASFTGLGN